MEDRRLGPHQKKALAFAQRYPGVHSMNNDTLTEGVIHSLVSKGYLRLNEFNQFAITEKGKSVDLKPNNDAFLQD